LGAQIRSHFVFVVDALQAEKRNNELTSTIVGDPNIPRIRAGPKYAAPMRLDGSGETLQKACLAHPNSARYADETQFRCSNEVLEQNIEFLVIREDRKRR
jgi:hypothetical protein